MKILLVDDSPIISTVVRDYFESQGYCVLSAANGREGLEVLKEETPDLIISDISMPIMNGWDFYLQLRRDPATTSIPFIFFTTRDGAPDMVKGLEMGADDYITKPFDMEALHAKVLKIVKKMEATEKPTGNGRPTISGHTSEMGLEDLLQVFHHNKKTGVLKINRGSEAGAIFLRDGRVVDATTGRVDGPKAVYRMLAWKDAQYELEPMPKEGVEERFDGSVENLLLEGTRQQDEMRRLGKMVPPPDLMLGIDLDALEKLDELSATEQEVLVELRTHERVGDLLDSAKLDDVEILRVLISLRKKGVIKIQS